MHTASPPSVAADRLAGAGVATVAVSSPAAGARLPSERCLDLDLPPFALLFCLLCLLLVSFDARRRFVDAAALPLRRTAAAPCGKHVFRLSQHVSPRGLSRACLGIIHIHPF
jgi:hypothetical protein